MDRKKIVKLVDSIIDRYPRSKKYRIFYLDLNEETETIIKNTELLHEMQMIPWPDIKCILICSSTTDDRLLGYLVENNKFISFMIDLNNRVISLPGVFSPEYIDRPDFITRESLEETEFVKVMKSTGSDFVFAFPVKKAIIFNNDKYYEHVKISANIGNKLIISTCILVQLSPLIAPCGYKVSANLPRFSGSGTHSGTYKVESLINFNRFYNLYEKSTGKSSERTPHPRRGHLRFWWKYSGVDKSNLPLSPAERLRYAFEHDVKKSHVKPFWVGGGFVTKDGISITCGDY